MGIPQQGLRFSRSARAPSRKSYWTIRSSAKSRRNLASNGWSTGSYASGAVRIPARVADCRIVRRRPFTPKYVCAAASIPYAPCPKYTVLRYVSRILSFDRLRSTLIARSTSRTFSFTVRGGIT